MPKNLEGDLVRRKAGEIPKTSAEELARLRVLQEGPVDTSDIPERTHRRRLVRDASGKLPGRSGLIREAGVEKSRLNDPRYSESKLDGTVQFLVDDTMRPPDQPAPPIGGQHSATFHLVEFRLDPSTIHWFGAVEVACDILQVTEDATAAGMAAVPPGYARDLGEYLMQVRLADGRWGLTRIRISSGVFEADGDNHRLDFVGLSPLGK
jgi:hypothetical protein